MIFQVFLTCSCTILLVHGQRFSKSIHPQTQMGYSSSVVHSQSDANDLQSHSSVRVNFQPQEEVAVHSSTGRGTLKYLQPNNNMPSNNFYSRTNVGNNPKESSAFNVGYNISFSNTGGAAKRRRPTYTRANTKKLENAEVITGKSKKNEKVRAPAISIDHQSPQDFVSNAFIKHNQISSDSLRLNTSPITSQGSTSSVKFLNPVREYASKLTSQSPKFTYNTQQNIFRDVIKATKPDPIQLGQEFKTSYQTSGRWNNLGNGLEISKSIEPQISEENYRNRYNPRYANSKATTHEQPRNFNHDSALQASQAFDFSNAHGELLYDQNDNSPQASEQYNQKTKTMRYDQSTNLNNLEDSFNHQQFSDLSNINIEAHIPARLRGIKPLPLDTSLLKDAVLMTDFREVPKDPRVIPIRFDISNIEKAMKEQLAHIQNYPVQHKSYPNTQLSDSSPMTGLTYENHESAESQDKFRIYGKSKPVDTNKYNKGYYEKQRSEFNSDVYKIVSMRPPPVGYNVRY